jgi:hypothetical protein
MRREFFFHFFFCGILAIFQLQKGLEGPNISSEQLGETADQL